MIGRREFIALLGGATAMGPLAASAQTKRARIGWFTVAPHPYVEGFRRGLKELGWIEGENVVIEHTYADGHLSDCRGWPRYWRACRTIWSWFRVLTQSKLRARQFNQYPSWAFPAPWAWAEAAWRGQRAT